MQLTSEQRARLNIRAQLICRAARRDPVEFTRWVGRIEGGAAINVAETHREWHRILDEHDQVAILAPVGHAKRLSIDTPIATPLGWRNIGDLAVGDEVIGVDGLPTVVTCASDIELADDCYELTFRDGAKVEADAGHFWSAWTQSDRKHGKSTRVVTTKKIVDNFKSGSGKTFRWSVPLTAPVQYPAKNLPVDPYALGAWLGDESSCTASSELALLGNKRIPEVYLLGSEQQRRSLLAGLLDTSGTVGKDGNRCRFTHTNKAIAQGVQELVRSLGCLACLNTRQQTHTVNWTYYGAACEKQPRSRTIVAWRKLTPRPMRCIAVAASHHNYLATRSYVVTHNTNQITRWRVLWEIGRNPNIRIAIVSSSKELPTKALNGIKQDIDGGGAGSEWLKLIFPHLARRHWTVWRDDRLSLSRTGAFNDPTISIFSPGTKILGSRFDLIIADDLHDIKNTLTPESRDKMHRWLTGEVFSRDNPAGTRFWVLGHVWHEDDCLHRLIRDGFFYKKYSCYVEDPETGARVPLIPEMWSLAQLAARERRLGPINAKLMLHNELVDSGTGRIRREYFVECLRRGATLGARFATHWDPNDAPTVTGVDLGFGGGSLTVAFTAAVFPDGSRRILEIRSGDWTGPEMIDQLKDVHQKFGSYIVVESNGAQTLLEEFATDLTALPIKKHHTNMNKHDLRYGVEHVATELVNSKWIIPCTRSVSDVLGEEFQPNSEIAYWINECVAYSPDTHAGDRLMASWICREGIRKLGLNSGKLPETHWDIDSLQR